MIKNAHRSRVQRDLDVLRALCMGTTLLTSEISAAPNLVIERSPAAPPRATRDDAGEDDRPPLGGPDTLPGSSEL